MKTAEEVRSLRLRELVEELGSIKALNVLTGKNERDSTYSQILNRSKSSVTGRPKEMGPAMARALEEACKKPRGWMDTPPQQSAPTNPAWPFPDISPLRYWALPERLRGRAEERVLAIVMEWEAEHGEP